jgi:hypothetical protein
MRPLRLARSRDENEVGDRRSVPRIKRKARNQTLFREVNERIAELSAKLDGRTTQGFICECARTGCTEIVNVPLQTYTRVRDDPTLFLLVSGHQDPDHEIVIENLGSYLIAQTKPGAATQIAVQTAKSADSP